MRTCMICNTADKLALTCPNCGCADWAEVETKPGAAAPACACGAPLSKGGISCSVCGAPIGLVPAAAPDPAPEAPAAPDPAPEAPAAPDPGTTPAAEPSAPAPAPKRSR